jgi:hypothetical protein
MEPDNVVLLTSKKLHMFNVKKTTCRKLLKLFEAHNLLTAEHHKGRATRVRLCLDTTPVTFTEIKQQMTGLSYIPAF